METILERSVGGKLNTAELEAEIKAADPAVTGILYEEPATITQFKTALRTWTAAEVADPPDYVGEKVIVEGEPFFDKFGNTQRIKTETTTNTPERVIIFHSTTLDRQAIISAIQAHSPQKSNSEIADEQDPIEDLKRRVSALEG